MPPSANRTTFARPHSRIKPTERLLPNEPRIPDYERQQGLTERYLLPYLAQLEAFFLAVRVQVDPALQAAQPVKLGKPYPIGQCLEISQAVQKQLSDRAGIVFTEEAAAIGRDAYQAFRRAGGAFRLVWGDLRNTYFQNAFQLGTLYVDVSNDTVTPTKPKVEILAFELAQLLPVADFHHFADLASRYWQHRIYPNHVLPAIAPYCPLIHISPAGKVAIHDASAYMVGLAQRDQFLSSERALRVDLMPPAVFEWVADALRPSRLTVASTVSEGRAQALALCRSYRDKRWHLSSTETHKLIRKVGLANRELHNAGHYRYGGQPDLDYSASRTQSPEADVRRTSSSKRNYRPVSFAAHGRKRLQKHTSFTFAAADTLVLLTTQELPKAIMTMPVAFARKDGHFLLVGVLGSRQNTNKFVGRDGRWLGAYLPRAYRHWPFALNTGAAEQAVLCIDESSDQLSGLAGEPLFEKNGKPAGCLEAALKDLTTFEAERGATQELCNLLDRHGLIKAWPAPVLEGATAHGLYCIDEQKLNSLGATALHGLRRSGGLVTAYCQLLSMNQTV